MATNPTLTQFPAGETTYKINFDYLARQFVVLTLVNSADVSQNRELVANVDYRFLNSTTVSVTADQTGFDIMRIHRYTSAERLVDFRDGSTLTASDLTIAELQAIHIAEEGREYTLTLANEAVEKSQDAADRAEDAADRAEDAAESINNSIVPGGADVIGTRHRGRLNLDLDAIDRRPDGYGNSPNMVLGNGRDVQISTDLSLAAPILLDDYQVVQGVGGSVTMTAVARAVHAEFKKGFYIKDLRSTGNIINGPSTGNVAYCVQLEDSENFRIVGLDARQFSGATELLRCSDFVVRDVLARNMRYHDNVAAGGYGVLMGGCKRGLIDGINFRASSADGDLGRHALYISVDPNGNFCEDIIVKNLIALYVNIDNRNMPGVVVRRSNRCMLDGFNINGANGGVGFNADNGTIQDFQLRNGHIRILQYDDNAVYGVSGGVDGQPATLVGLRVDNVTIELEVKSGATPASVRLHAMSLTCRDSRFSNLRFKSHGSSNPILVPAGAMNLVYDGISDFVTSGSASGAALIRFQGTNSNISVLNIKTARTPFVGLENVTDLTVNWERFARIVSNNGTITQTDANSLISSISATGTGELTVTFNGHVTADAVRNCTVLPESVAGQVVQKEVSGKTVKLKFYDATGALVNLSSAIVSAAITLHS